MTTRVFFTSDLHGSERCFLKFVNAGKHYRANVLIVGGDITGKMLVPMVEKDGKYEIDYMGGRRELSSKSEVDDLTKQIADAGGYAYRFGPGEFERLVSDKPKLDSFFEHLIAERMRGWVEIAEQRLKGTGISCFLNPGNDDSHVVDEVIRRSDYVIMPEGEVVTLDSKHEMISTGYANITPWNCPRDVTEEELEKRLEDMAGRAKNMRRCVFNLHCPPFDTPLDLAPRLDENLKPVLAPGGGYEMAHVGSVSVRKVIEKYRPLIGLHGHIHESRGLVKLGNTLCINPGSEYLDGVLRGAIIDLDDGVKSYLLTEG